jgi:hypothetical protein
LDILRGKLSGSESRLPRRERCVTRLAASDAANAGRVNVVAHFSIEKCVNTAVLTMYAFAHVSLGAFFACLQPTDFNEIIGGVAGLFGCSGPDLSRRLSRHVSGSGYMF